jgi:hypothetical protein
MQVFATMTPAELVETAVKTGHGGDAETAKVQAVADRSEPTLDPSAVPVAGALS